MWKPPRRPELDVIDGSGEGPPKTLRDQMRYLLISYDVGALLLGARRFGELLDELTTLTDGTYEEHFEAWAQKKRDALDAAEPLFDRRDELFDKEWLTDAEEGELEELRAKIRELPTAPTPQIQEDMDFIREAAAALRSASSDEPPEGADRG